MASVTAWSWSRRGAWPRRSAPRPSRGGRGPACDRGSSLTADLPVPKHRDEAAMAAAIPSTYVPAATRVPRRRARSRRDTRRHRARGRHERARLLGLPRLPAGVRARVRIARGSRHASRRRGARASPCTRRSWSWTRRVSSGWACPLGVDYALTHSCYDPRPPGSRAASATAAGCARRASAKPGCPTPPVTQELRSRPPCVLNW
jgi:7-cyano-7-deazaguanine synthase